MMKNARNVALGGCLAALGMVSVASVAFGQVITPPDNCHCGPINDCDGIPMSHSTYCAPGWACGCVGTKSQSQDCFVGIQAICFLPGAE